MLNQRQGVRSTKSLQAGKSSDYKRDSPEIDGDTNEVIEKKQDIFIAVHDPKDTMKTDQKGKLPVRSSRGQQYQVVAHYIDINWTLVDTTKRRTEGELIAA